MKILFLNLTLYLIWLFIFFKKEKKITVYSFLILFYTTIAGIGCYILEVGIYSKTFGFSKENILSLEPYLYCFLGYWLLLLPFKGLKIHNFENETLFNNKKVRLFIKGWIIYFSLYSLLKFSEMIITLMTGLANAYDLRHNQGESLFTYNNIILNKFNGYGYFLLEATTPLIMVYAIIGIYKQKVSNRLSSILILLCFLPQICSSIASGSRGGLFMTMLCFIFFVLILWQYIPRNFIRKLTFIGVGFCSFVILYSWLITTDRTDGYDSLSSILRYFGESFPNLGFLYWDNVIEHPMGERHFPNLFFDNAAKFYSSTDESYSYWLQRTGVPVISFKTYFGDLYIEYGLFGAFIFIGISTIIFKILFNKKGATIVTLPLLYFYYQICVFAFAGYTKTGHQAIFELVIIVLIMIFVNKITNKKDEDRNSLTI